MKLFLILATIFVVFICIFIKTSFAQQLIIRPSKMFMLPNDQDITFFCRAQSNFDIPRYDNWIDFYVNGQLVGTRMIDRYSKYYLIIKLTLKFFFYLFFKTGLMSIFTYPKAEHSIQEAYCQTRFTIPKIKSNILRISKLRKYNLEVKEVTKLSHELVCTVEIEIPILFPSNAYKIDFMMNQNIKLATWTMAKSENGILKSKWTEPSVELKKSLKNIEIRRGSVSDNNTQFSAFILISSSQPSPTTFDYQLSCAFSSYGLSEYQSNFWYPYGIPTTAVEKTVFTTTEKIATTNQYTPSNRYESSVCHLLFYLFLFLCFC